MACHCLATKCVHYSNRTWRYYRIRHYRNSVITLEGPPIAVVSRAIKSLRPIVRPEICHKGCFHVVIRGNAMHKAAVRDRTSCELVKAARQVLSEIPRCGCNVSVIN